MSFTITNVRYVPSFKYTLVSVDQLWQEQRVDSRFKDLHYLQFPRTGLLSGLRVPFDPTSRLNSITVGSLAGLQGGKLTPLMPAPFKASVPTIVPVPAVPAKPTASLAASDKPAAMQPTQRTKHSALLFHRPKSTSYINSMPASRAGELLHRRSHLGHAKIRALPNSSKDAPKNLGAIQANDHTCPHCAQANIKKASHSGTLDTPAERGYGLRRGYG